MPSSEHERAIMVVVRKYGLLCRGLTFVEDLRKTTETLSRFNLHREHHE